MLVYSIKEVSKMVHLPSHTLRYYEDCGFFSNAGRDAAGRRVYSDTNLEEIILVKCLRACNLSIDQIRRFFSITKMPFPERQIYLQEYLRLIKDKQSEFSRAVQLLEKWMQPLPK